MRFGKSIILTLALVAFSAGASSQTAASGSKRAVSPSNKQSDSKRTSTVSNSPRSSAAPVYLDRPLPVTVTSVGPNFLGHDIRTVTSSIERSSFSAPKSQFETTGQYESRVNAFHQQDWKRVFVLPTVNESLYGGGVEFSYDADQQILTASLEAASSRGPRDGSGFCIRHDSTSAGSYVGENAYGARRLVKRSNSDNYELLLLDDNNFFEASKYLSDGMKASIQLPMKTAEAMDVQRNLRIAIAGTVAEPRVYDSVSKAKATVTDPYEIDIHTRSIVFRPDELWVFDRRTGRILNKVVPSVAPPPPPPAQPQSTPAQRPPIPVPVIPRSIRERGDLMAAKLVRGVPPIYPPLAKQARIGGTVRFNAVIARDGTIQNLTLVSGHPLLIPAAQDSVRQGRYEPTLVDGEPVEVVTTIDVFFKLPESNQP